MQRIPWKRANRGGKTYFRLDGPRWEKEQAQIDSAGVMHRLFRFASRTLAPGRS